MNFKQFLLTPAILLVFAATTFAQNQDYKHTISVSAGANIWQFANLIKGDVQDSLGIDATIDIKARGSYGLQYDYGVKKWFSLGFSVATNSIDFSSSNIEIDREDGTIYSGPVDLKLRRTNVTLRPLFHYGNGGRIDMYSGLRLGINLWNAKLSYDENQAEFLPSDLNGRFRGNSASVAIQVIPFGLRGYVTKNLALGVEVLSIGAPHYAALQLSYRM